jgi:aspartate 1-decarboxylase
MRRRMVNGKVHRARVTDADLNYVGSISIDPILMKAADIVPNEQVSVYNLMNGARFETYAIEGDDGQICLNGAAARLAQVGDLRRCRRRRGLPAPAVRGPRGRGEPADGSTVTGTDPLGP